MGDGFILDWGPSIKAVAAIQLKTAQTPWFGNQFIDDGDGPRCSGRASPEVIDYSCLSDNEAHEWKTYRDYSTGDCDAQCIKCGREWCERDADITAPFNAEIWALAMDAVVQADPILKAGIDELRRGTGSWDVIKRKRDK